MYNKQEIICLFSLSFYRVVKKAMCAIALFAFVRLVFQLAENVKAMISVWEIR